MDIPYTELSPTALRGIIEEFITREGTDYGQTEYALEEKILQVEGQIRRGEVVISFDPTANTCSLRTVE